MPSAPTSNASGIKALVPIAFAGMWRGRRWIVAATVAGTLFGVFRAVVTPSEYRSIGKLFVRPGLREVVVPDAAFAEAASSSVRASGSREAILNKLQVLASPELYELVVHKIGADAVLAPFNPVTGDESGASWQTRMFHAFQAWWFGSGDGAAAGGSASPSGPPVDRHQLASNILARRVIIVPEAGASVISIYYHASSPERARIVVNGVLDAARELDRKVFETMSGVEKIEEEYRATEALARQAETALREFRVERDIYDFTAQHDALLTYLGALNRQIDDLDLEIRGKQGELAALGPLLASIPPTRMATESQTFVANPEYAAWSSLLVSLRQQAVMVDVGNTTRKELLQAEIANAIERLNKEKPLVKSDGILEANPEHLRVAQRQADLEIDLKGAEARRQQLVVLRNTQRGELNKLEALGPEFRALEIDARQKRAAADRLAEGAANMRAVQRLEQLNLSNLLTLQSGTFEPDKIAPGRAKLVVFGSAGGGAVGTAIAVLLALLGSRVRLRADLVRLGVPEALAIRSQRDLGPVPADHPKLLPEFASVRSDITSLWATLPYDRRAKDGLKIAFLGCGGADAGCAAAALAIGLALHGGERVAYVAGSGLGGWLARTLGLSEAQGWADAVVGLAEAAGAPPAPPLLATRVPGLAYCAMGETSAHDRHPLAEPAFAAMLERLSSSHRFVIVDLPSLATHPETRAVLGLIDGAYVVAREEATAKHELRTTLAAVAGAGTRLMACILQAAPDDQDGEA